MTGTGTQADPYIVSTWEDFVTAVNTTDAYVEFVENTVIDMNNVLPTGVNTDITANCTQVDGKGSVIKNLYLTDNAYWNLYKSGGIMKNLSLVNMRRDGTSGETFSIYGTFTFYNCVITGSFGGEYIFNCGKVIFQSCSIAMQVQNCIFAHNAYYDERCPNFVNSFLRVYGDARLTGNVGQICLENSIIFGVLPSTSIYRSTKSIVDCTVPDDTSIRVNNGSAYINSDKFGTGVTTTNCVRLTTEQIQSPEYLFSIGFPIGVD